MARKLARHFKNIEALMNANFEELITVDEIGEKIAQSLLNYFHKEEHQEIIQKLVASGLQFNLAKQEEEHEDKLSGKVFVVSGVFEKFSRDQIKSMIEQYGGKNVGSISSKTDFVLAGDKMGPSKKEKAAKLGIPVISETEFLEMIAG